MIHFIRDHRMAVVAFLLGLLTLASGILAVVAFLPLLVVGHSPLAIPPAVALLLVEILAPLSFLLIVPTWHAVKKSEGKDGGRRWVVLGIAGLLGGIALGASVPLSEAAGEGYHQAQITANLRRIGLALLYYHDQYGHLPPPVVKDEDGQPLYSWRVVLLPFLGEDALYREFNLDEPWDSPHNYALLARMPEVYSTPGATTREPYGTFYQFVVGDATVFQGPKPPRIPMSFPKGSSKTVLVAEAAKEVPWTKPADLQFDPRTPLASLGTMSQRRVLLPARHCGGVHLLRADSSVVFFSGEEMRKQEQVIRQAIDQTIDFRFDADW